MEQISEVFDGQFKTLTLLSLMNFVHLEDSFVLKA